MWITDARPWAGAPADVLIEGEPIAQVCPREGGAGAPGREGEAVVEGRGRLLLPAFADVHVHLDSNGFRADALSLV
ncbi:hypothetical protein [Serinicoccus marinus]|uniref:hypothetical protein n=1 Tax=Serinicoccus marinus TaxID=247333 RepID=UPI00040D073D|nr:hypothetical protein [Serinicoccus marinus]